MSPFNLHCADLIFSSHFGNIGLILSQFKNVVLPKPVLGRMRDVGANLTQLSLKF